MYKNNLSLENFKNAMPDRNSILLYLKKNIPLSKYSFYDNINQSFPNINFMKFDWLSSNGLNTFWWRIQQLPFLYFYLTDPLKNTDIFNYVKASFIHWIELNKSNNTRFLWHDHAAALRFDNIVLWISFIIITDKQNLILDIQDEIFESILAHIQFLLDDKNYSKNTNHGFDQSFSLYKFCLMQQNTDEIIPLLNIAKQRLKSEIEFAFTEEGVHKENSPGYHSYMLNQISKLEGLKTLSKYNYLSGVDKIIPYAQKFLNAITLPNGKLPLIGDTSVKHTPGKYLFSHKNLSIYDYCNSGYFIITGVTYDKKNFHIVVKSGFESQYHRHDDDLSIHLYVNGEILLGDAGFHSYIEDHPCRLFVRSPLAHNTVYPERYVCIRRLDKLNFRSSLIFDKKNLILTAKTGIYGGVLQRKIDFSCILHGYIYIYDSWIEKPNEYSKLIVNFYIQNTPVCIFFKKNMIPEVTFKKNKLVIYSKYMNKNISPNIFFNNINNRICFSPDFMNEMDAIRIAYCVENNEQNLHTPIFTTVYF